MAATTIRRCTIPGCRNELSPRSRLDECQPCRAYLVRYLTMSPARVLDRRQKIHLYDSRLQAVMPGDPESLTDSSRMVPPANYKPQGKRGKAILKKHPARRSSKHEARASE